MRLLAGVQESRATFVEEKRLALLASPLESRGTLVWTAPDHLEKHTQAPVQEDIVVTGDRLAYRKPADSLDRTLSLDAVPELRGLVEAVRGTLAGDLKTLRRYYSVGLEGPLDGWRLTLVPVDARIKGFLKAVRIDGAQGQVRVVETIEPDGDLATMTITPVAP